VVGLLIGVSVVADARTLVAYQTDWFKQVALIEWARVLPELRDARHIRVIDDATRLDALRRTYRFYEYNALLSQALGDRRRFSSLTDREPSAEDLRDYISRPAYHMDEYVPGPVDHELRITPGEAQPGPLGLLSLLAAEAMDPLAFARDVRRLIEVEVAPVTGTGRSGHSG
jgi:hypothetical protein